MLQKLIILTLDLKKFMHRTKIFQKLILSARSLADRCEKWIKRAFIPALLSGRVCVQFAFSSCICVQILDDLLFSLISSDRAQKVFKTISTVTYNFFSSSLLHNFSSSCSGGVMQTSNIIVSVIHALEVCHHKA